MNQYFGWVQGSDMPSTYVHLSGRDVDAAILRTYGINVQDDEARDKLAPRRCTQCGKENPPTNKYCGLCGLPLDEHAARAVLQHDLDRKLADQIMDKLLQDQEVRSLLKRKLRQLANRRITAKALA